MGMRISPSLEAAILSQAGINPCLGLSEKHFQAKVVALAEGCGWAPYHTHDSRRSRKGFPDLVMIRNGVLLVAELKAGRNKTTPEQEKWLRLFEGVGARVRRWRPEHWWDIQKELAA